MSIDVKDILFWIFLAFSMILLIWTVFGNSPSEFITLSSFIFTVLLKVWKISDRQIISKMKFGNLETKFNGLENSFINLAKDFKEHIKHK